MMRPFALTSISTSPVVRRKSLIAKFAKNRRRGREEKPAETLTI
jgi:hypothetical protein